MELVSVQKKLSLIEFQISQVATVPEDVGTAGALRAIGHHLTAHDILVGVFTFPGMNCFDNLLLIFFFVFLVGCEW